MSLWSQCIKEREGRDVIEESWGFIEYLIRPPNVEIHDLYVQPEFRGQGKGQELANRVATLGREQGCTALWSNVYVDSLNASETLRLNLTYGLKVRSADGGRIILAKELGE